MNAGEISAAALQDRGPLQETLGAQVSDELLERALTHRSFAHEAGGIPTNERLEFLGDSVLGIVVTDFLFNRYPDASEGELAKMRAATVSQRALANLARTLNLGDYILLGRGELLTGGRDKDSILADTLEALFGAIYLEHGFETSREAVLRLSSSILANASRLAASLDWKTSLQELVNVHGLPDPEYFIESTGPDHDRTFTARAIVGEFEATGVGTSKRVAEHAAAEGLYEQITDRFANDA